MVSELTEGMGETGVKAGAMKVATSLGRIREFEEKVLRAAPRAHRRTGAPIITHTESGTMGKEQIDIFESEGADVSRVIIGHCCGNSDLRYHFDILKYSANVGVDRVGLPSQMPDGIRRVMAQTFIAAGYALHLVLSQDIVGVCYGRATLAPPRPPERAYLTYRPISFPSCGKRASAKVYRKHHGRAAKEVLRRLKGLLKSFSPAILAPMNRGEGR